MRPARPFAVGIAHIVCSMIQWGISKTAVDFSVPKKGGDAILTVSAFLLSYSLVRSLLSRSASARRTVCCKRERSRFKSARGSLCRMVGVVTAVPWSTRAILSPTCLFPRLGVDTSMAAGCQSKISNREVKHVIHGWAMWRELKTCGLLSEFHMPTRVGVGSGQKASNTLHTHVASASLSTSKASAYTRRIIP